MQNTKCMFNLFRHMFTLALALLSTFEVAAQASMPDNVYIGNTKHYNVDPNSSPGSTYTWKIDGVIQVGFITHEIDITWKNEGKYLLEVQERSLDGCIGPVRSGQVFVNPIPGLSAEGINPANCDADGSIHFTFTNVPDGTYTLVYDEGSFSNVAIVGGNANVTAPLGIYRNLNISIAGYITAPGVNVTLVAPVIPPPPLVFVNKNVSCNGFADGEITVTIKGGHPEYYYSLNGGATWSATAFSSPFTVKGLFSNSYAVIIKDAKGCISAPSETVTISQPEALSVSTTETLVDYSSGNIVTAIANGGTSPYSYLWSNGKTSSTIKDLTSGKYSVEITDKYGCKTTNSFEFPIEINQILANHDYARTSWMQDTSINVLANDQSIVDFIIESVRVIKHPRLGEAKVNANGTITYFPQGRRSGRDQFVYEVCNIVNLCASATVTIDISESGIAIPTGFSPNGDGVNDRFTIVRLEKFSQSHLYVFTRTGLLVYQSTDYQNDWDGKSIREIITNLEIVPTGVYYYVLKLGGTNRSVKGFVYVGY